MLGLWLWYFVTALLLIVGLACFDIEGAAILGWMFLSLASGSLVFLLKQRRKFLHFFAVLLFHILVAALLGLFSRRCLNIDEDGAYLLGIAAFANLFVLYSFERCGRRWPKVLSTLLLMVVVAGDLLEAAMPKVWATEFRVGVFVGIFTIVVGVYLVLRKGILSRLCGVGVVGLAIAAVLFSFYMSAQLTDMVGEDREKVLEHTRPQIENLLSGWNEGDYEKFTADFDSSLKERLDEAAFAEMRQAVGECISKGEPSSVASQNIYQKLVSFYPAQFAEEPYVEMVFAFTESQTDRWEIIGLSFSAVEPAGEVPAE